MKVKVLCSQCYGITEIDIPDDSFKKSCMAVDCDGNAIAYTCCDCGYENHVRVIIG
jgi:hypothetical protein